MKDYIQLKITKKSAGKFAVKKQRHNKFSRNYQKKVTLSAKHL